MMNATGGVARRCAACGLMVMFGTAVLLSSSVAMADDLRLSPGIGPVLRSAGQLHARPIAPPPEVPFKKMVEPTSFTFEGMDFEANAEVSDYFHRFPDTSGAVGPNHVVSMVYGAITWHTKAGVLEDAKRLGLNTLGLAEGSFFEPLAPLSSCRFGRVQYDPFAERFVVVALDLTAVALGHASNSCSLLLAVSDDSDPNGTWHFYRLGAVSVVLGQSSFAYEPKVAVGPNAIYISADFFAFSNLSWRGSLMFIVDKTPLYSGGAGVANLYDPVTASGLSDQTVSDGSGRVPALEPTQMLSPPPAGVGTFLISTGWSTADGADFVAVLVIDDPLPALPFQGGAFVDLGGDILDFSIGSFSAQQQGTARTLYAGDYWTGKAAWRDGSLWTANTFGMTATQPHVHWIRINTEDFTVTEQGDVNAESLAPGTVSYYPSITVNSRGNMALGFMASGPNLYPGAYYTGRLATDPPGATDPPEVLAAGMDYYYRAFGGTYNELGFLSATVVDPVSDAFWVYGAYALPRGTVFVDFPEEDGRWGTRWGSFTTATVPGDFDFNGYVERADYLRFLPCGTGPEVDYVAGPLPAGCDFTPDPQGIIPPDLDRDGDVDQDDYGIFQRCFSGSEQEADPDCAD